MGNITSWTYNAQGQALTQTDPDPDGAGPLPAAVTTFTYDLRGLRSSVTDASGNTTSYGYDHAGRLGESIDPRGNSSYYQYDAAGQVTRVVDRNSRKRDFSYNDLGLVTSEVWVDGFGNAVKTIVHIYDDAGRETSISDGVTGYNYQYDLADRLTQVDNAGSVDMPQVQLRSYYDFEGNRTWLSDSQGGSVAYGWYNQRLQSMALYTENYKSAQVGFSYDPVGRMNSISRVANQDYSTTINTSYTLDLLDRVTSITHDKISGEESVALSQFSYTYDANGRVVASTGPEGSLSFALDANGQLLSVTGSRSGDYAFDATGNRSSNTTAAGNLLLNDGKYSYTYDLEGNQKNKTRISDGQVTEFFWDYRNQLTKALVKDANGVVLKELRFTYDVEGRRVGSWVDADGAGPEDPDQVWTVFDGVNPYMDFDGAGLLKTRYLYGPGIDELFARIGTGEDPQWYLADRLGSVRQIVDASGAILDEITYDSFGNVLSESNPTHGDRFKFTGREFSPELGIYYYRARWYDPSAGRFISQDPIGFSAGDVNLYRYVGNAPGDATDPLGKSPTLISGGIGAAGGFVIGGAIGWWNGSGFWSGAGHGFVIGGVTGLTAGVGAGLFGGAAGTVVGGTVGGFIGGATTDAVTQGVEIGLGWREEYSFTQNVFSGSIGSIFGAGSSIFRQCKTIRAPSAPTGRPSSPNLVNPNVPGPLVPPSRIFGSLFQDWGRDIIRWGTGAGGAQARQKTITLQELTQAEVTNAQAQAARNFYAGVLAKNPGNAAAAARVKLMDHILSLLGGS